MEGLFWFSLAFVAYTYLGYPLLIDVWARWARGAARNAPVPPAAALPGVTIVVAARDEARRLPSRLDNLLALDYPADLIQIIVASDGSTDATEEALASYRPRVDLLMLPAAGKANGLNAAVARAQHPILLFADARQRFAPDAVRHLVRHFADPRVGAVSGELMIDGGSREPGFADRESDQASTIGEGVGAYWRYEKWLRRRESIVGSTLGVTGAIYAMRRWLWRPLPLGTILDDVLGPMRLVLRGYRVTFEPAARAFDAPAADAAAERRRKVRTLAGNFQMLAREPRLLVPGLNPVWLQFMSHKVARLAVPYALAALLVTSVWLAADSLIYAAAAAGQAAFYGLAAYGALLERRARRTPAAAGEALREAA